MSSQLANGLSRAIALRKAQKEARDSLYAVEDAKDPFNNSNMDSTPPITYLDLIAIEKGGLPVVFDTSSLEVAKPGDACFPAVDSEGVCRMYKERRPRTPREKETPQPHQHAVSLPLVDGSMLNTSLTPAQQQQLVDTALQIQRNNAQKAVLEVEVQKSQVWTNRMNTGFTVLGVVVFGLGVVWGIRKETSP